MEKKLRVLIVEDEWEYSDNLRDILEERGFYVEEAATGEEALDKMRSRDFDLALIDIKLPGMSGTETLKRIREKYADTIAIMMTAYASIESAVEALKHGAFAYLYKPVNVDELLVYIEKACERRDIITSFRRQANILENLSAAVLSTNAQGIINFWNKRAVELFQWSSEEVLGKGVDLIFPAGIVDGKKFKELDLQQLHRKTKAVYPQNRQGKQIKAYLNLALVEKEKKTTDIIWTLMEMPDNKNPNLFNS